MQRRVAPWFVGSCSDSQGSGRRDDRLLAGTVRRRGAARQSTALVDVEVPVFELVVEADVVHLLEGVVFGGADAHAWMAPAAQELHPAMMSEGF